MKIKQAAIKLFEELGLDFTLDQLQSMAGVSRATLYRRIGSKEKLLQQLTREGLITLESAPDIEARIFSATREIVAEQGFVGCTMEQIADEANLGVATLYRRYRDKENLLRSFVKAIKPVLAIKSVRQNDDATIEEGLSLIVNSALVFLDANQKLVKILFSWQSSERAYLSGIREDSSSTFNQIAQYLTRQQQLGKLRQDVSARDMALSLSGLLFQYAIFSPVHLGRPLNIKSDSQTIVRLFLNGAKPPINKPD